MKFSAPLLEARLERRYQRFFADCLLGDGRRVTAHCANTGAMTGCAEPGATVWLKPAPAGTKRKLSYTWELTAVMGGYICVNTAQPNQVVAEALRADMVPELAGYAVLEREVRYGASRFDFRLSGPARPPCYVEVKSVTLLAADGSLRFPDAVTERGLKHLTELRAAHRAGARAVMLFLVGRPDGAWFRAAEEIDPAYAEGLRDAAANGVEILAYRTRISPEEITIGSPVATADPRQANEGVLS